MKSEFDNDDFLSNVGMKVMYLSPTGFDKWTYRNHSSLLTRARIVIE